MTYKDYLYSKAARQRIPLGGTFELSPVCNFSCHMCYVRKTKAELARLGKREITADEWIRMGKECRDAGMLYLLLTGGEPFLYLEFRRLYKALHEMGLLLILNTNGTLIDEETVGWLKDRAPSRVNVTLYGASRETYGRVCQNPDGFELAERGITLLKEAGIHVVVTSSIIPENKEDIQQIIEFAHGHGCQANIATYMFPPVRRERESSDSRLTAEESGRLNVLKQKYRLGDDKFTGAARWMLDKIEAEAARAEGDAWGTDTSREMQCRAGRSSFWINWEGKMTACGMMDFPVVCDPFQDGFLPCWEKITTEVRRQQVLKGCDGCTKKEICHPCAAIMKAETGSVNEKAPYLCRMTEVSEQVWREQLASMEGRNDEQQEEKEENKI